eukprot:scaffold2397_cov273-Chaetoceros_neogracile.AAC.2
MLYNTLHYLSSRTIPAFKRIIVQLYIRHENTEPRITDTRTGVWESNGDFKRKAFANFTSLSSKTSEYIENTIVDGSEFIGTKLTAHHILPRLAAHARNFNLSEHYTIGWTTINAHRAICILQMTGIFRQENDLEGISTEDSLFTLSTVQNLNGFTLERNNLVDNTTIGRLDEVGVYCMIDSRRVAIIRVGKTNDGFGNRLETQSWAQTDVNQSPFNGGINHVCAQSWVHLIIASLAHSIVNTITGEHKIVRFNDYWTTQDS